MDLKNDGEFFSEESFKELCFVTCQLWSLKTIIIVEFWISGVSACRKISFPEVIFKPSKNLLLCVLERDQAKPALKEWRWWDCQSEPVGNGTWKLATAHTDPCLCAFALVIRPILQFPWEIQPRSQGVFVTLALRMCVYFPLLSSLAVQVESQHLSAIMWRYSHTSWFFPLFLQCSPGMTWVSFLLKYWV